VEASERVFRSGMLSGSLWAVNLLFFPDATRLVQWLAARMPDQALKDLTEVGPLLGGDLIGFCHGLCLPLGGCP
jgi:hypothetical protein